MAKNSSSKSLMPRKPRSVASTDVHPTAERDEHTGASEIDWVEIERQYQWIWDDLGSFELYGDKEFEELRLNELTYGLIEKPSWLKVEYGFAIYAPAMGEDDIHPHLWENIARQAQRTRQRSGHVTPSTQSDIDDEAAVDHLSIVQEGIARRQVTTAFLTSWAEINRLHAQFQLLKINQKKIDVKLGQAHAGRSRGIEIQKHWYAHWVVENAPTHETGDVIDAGDELAELCRNIVEKKIEPWKPYPLEWFERLLGDQKSDLGESFTRLTRRQLEQLAAHPLITPQVLPPLRRKKYRPLR